MIWKLIYELEQWIMIGIGSDIVTSPKQRPEYQHLVEQCKADCVPVEKIPSEVFLRLKKEAETVPFYKSPTFWRLVFLRVKKLF